MLYDEAKMALTKERLEDLRKEKKLSFEQLSKQLLNSKNGKQLNIPEVKL